MSTIPANIGIKELLLDVLPKRAKETFESSGAVNGLGGTLVTLVFEISNDTYSYIVKDGKDFEIKEGDIENALVRIKTPKETLEKMIETESLAIITELIFGLDKNRYNTISKLKGSFAAELANEDGSIFFVDVTFNGAQTPRAIFKMSTPDSIALMSKETNPVNLFLSGAMTIEGDMPFAMATQPLFS